MHLFGMNHVSDVPEKNKKNNYAGKSARGTFVKKGWSSPDKFFCFFPQ